jgi:tetratricopeptide (TPR) repeat protein
MRWHIGLGAALLLGLSMSGVLAAPTALDTPAAPAANEPWMQAGALIATTIADVQKSGGDGMKAHVPELEAALAAGAELFPPQVTPDGKLVILVDGPTEAVVAQGLRPPDNIAIMTAPNPYPQIGLMLAFYYNEAGRPQDALRVIDATIKLSALSELHLGAKLSALLTESSAAYVTMEHWGESLVAADAALEASQTDPDKARSFRSRGFALVELGRLDDAEAAYRDSLRLEPDNGLAKEEMGYIARLRTGAPRETPQGASAPEQQKTLVPPA